jgi:hypothetical protein
MSALSSALAISSGKSKPHLPQFGKKNIDFQKSLKLAGALPVLRSEAG